jgi:WD40 repeat protein
LVQTLRGHTTAVTTVDWRRTAAGELLVTGADDQTIMVWKCRRDSDSSCGTPVLSLIHTFCTSKLIQWHTVTYLALQDDSPYVVAVTQNGYVCAWNMVSKKEVGARLLLCRRVICVARSTDCVLEFYCLIRSVSLRVVSLLLLRTPLQAFMVHLHTASIEGLVWHPSNRLATVSSDCTANVFRLQSTTSFGSSHL